MTNLAVLGKLGLGRRLPIGGHLYKCYEAGFFHVESHIWTCPPGVTRICVVTIGGGAGGNAGGSHSGSGGGGTYKNDYPVVPGRNYLVKVGGGGYGSGFGTSMPGYDGGDSSFDDTVYGYGGGSEEWGWARSGTSAGGDVAGKGGAGSEFGYYYDAVARLGAGYFSAGSGGFYNRTASPEYEILGGCGGGGVSVYLGVLWDVTQNAKSIFDYVGTSPLEPGVGFGGGLDGELGLISGYGGHGGGYGGGGGSRATSGGHGGDGATGAVRIIWGEDRAFPATNTIKDYMGIPEGLN